MKAWTYYAFHTFINGVKKLFQSKFIIFFAVCVLFGGVFGFGIGMLFESVGDDEPDYSHLYLSDLTPDGEYLLLTTEEELYDGDDIYIDSTDETNLLNGENYAYTIVELNQYMTYASKSREELEPFIRSGQSLINNTFTVLPYGTGFLDGIDFSEEDIFVLVEAASLLALLIFVLFSMYFGAKKGCDIFLMADVNFLFPAPLKGQSVLLFRLSFQLLGTLLGCIYLVFQIPNLLNAGISLGVILFCFGAFILLLLMQKIINVLAYIICANHSFLKKNLQYFLIGIGAVIAGIYVLIYRSMGNDWLAALHLMFGPNASRYIPIFGWFKGMVGCGIRGQYVSCLVYTLLYLLSLVLVTYLTWNIKADFYEEALTGAATRDEVLQAAAENQSSVQRQKDRSDRIKRNMGMRGQGAAMFFHKEMYNRRRMSHLGIFSNTMITYFSIVACTCAFLHFVLKSDAFAVVPIEMAIILFFRSFGNPIETEQTNVWLNLVPAESVVKVFYSMLAGTVACTLDMLPSLLLGAIFLNGEPLLALVWYITLIALDFALSSSGVMLQALLPADGLDQLRAAIMLMIRFAMAGIIFAVIGVCSALLNMILGLCISIIICILLSLIGFFVYPLKMDRGF